MRGEQDSRCLQISRIALETVSRFRRKRKDEESKQLAGLNEAAIAAGAARWRDAAHQVGRLLQGAVRGTEASAALSFPVRPPCRHLEPPPHCSRRRRRRVPLEGLSHRRARTLEDDAASPARVHPALSHAPAAQGLPPHPPTTGENSLL